MEKLKKKWISQKSIESFLSENNIYDIIRIDGVVEKLYEEHNSQIENLFPNIITELDNKKCLSKLSEAVLFGTIINFLIRSKYFRFELSEILKVKVKRELLLEEIFSIIRDGHNYRNTLGYFSKKTELNYISVLLFERIMTTFSEFYYSVLETSIDEGWFTSDNPVMIKNFVKPNTFFSIDAEIIFPINRKYLVCCYHPSNNSPFFRKLQNKSCIICNSEMKNKIIEKFKSYNLAIKSKYLIFPIKLDYL